jgi:hypothetical protein
VIWQASDGINIPVSILETLGFYHVWEYGILPTNTAAQNDAGWAALLADLPQYGARVYIPASATSYKFATTIAPTTPIYLQGDGGGRPNQQEWDRTVLEWQGGTGNCIELLTRNCTGSRLEGFELENTGSATNGIYLNDTSAIQLENITMDVPDVKFTHAAIYAGATANVYDSNFRDIYIRSAAPYGIVISQAQAGTTLFACFVRNCSTSQILIGKDANAFDTHLIGCKIESNAGTPPAHGIEINRGEGVWVTQCHFEVPKDKYGVYIPNTAVKCEQLHILGSQFTYLIDDGGAYSGVAIYSNLATAQITVTGCRTRNNTGSTAVVVQNDAAEFVRVTNTQFDTSVSKFTSWLNAKGGDNFRLGTGQLDGHTIRVLEKNAFQNANSGSGEDQLRSYTLPGNTVSTAHRGLRYSAFGTTAANANNKRLRLYFDGQTLYDSTDIAANDKAWALDALILRFDDNEIRYKVTGVFNATAFCVTGSATLVTAWTADIIVLLTAEATNNDDLVCNGHTIEMVE